MSNHLVLVLTATINTHYFGNKSSVITDTDERKRQYSETLERYITESKFDRFVFVENTDSSLDEEYFLRLAENKHKEIEFLHCPTKISRGKSYGEALLLREAFIHSAFLSECECFYKVTGRIFVRNINKIINESIENAFVAYNFQEWVLTSFFKCRKDVFLKYLDSTVEKLYDEPPFLGPHIEHAYYSLLCEASCPVHTFRLFPDFDGLIGGTGNQYGKSRIGILARHVLIKVGFFSFRREKNIFDIVVKCIKERKASISVRKK